MKKSTKTIFFVVSSLLTISLLLAHILPFREKLNSFENSFYKKKNEFGEMSQDFKKKIGIEDFIATSNQLIEFSSLDQDLSQKFEVLIKERGLLRKMLYRKPEVKSEEFDAIKAKKENIVQALPSYIRNAISNEGMTLNGTNISFGTITDIEFEVKLYSENLNNLNNQIRLLNQEFGVDYKLSNDDLEQVKIQNGEFIGKLLVSFNDRIESSLSAIESMMSVSEISKEIERINDFAVVNKRIINKISIIGVETNLISDFQSDINSKMEKYQEITSILKSTINAQRKSNDFLKKGLKEIDFANNRLRNMERFSSSSQVQQVYNSWVLAEKTIKKAYPPLKNRLRKNFHKQIWSNINHSAREKINQIANEVSNHKQFIYNELQEARRDESSIQGSVKRTTKRGLNRFKKGLTRLSRKINSNAKQFASSRMGKELGVSVKGLILGTKALYDLTDPNVDPMAWAVQLDSDLAKLEIENREVARMEGPSFTGRNTFIERAINNSYEKAFNQ